MTATCYNKPEHHFTGRKAGNYQDKRSVAGCLKIDARAVMSAEERSSQEVNRRRKASHKQGKAGKKKNSGEVRRGRRGAANGQEGKGSKGQKVPPGQAAGKKRMPSPSLKSRDLIPRKEKRDPAETGAGRKNPQNRRASLFGERRQLLTSPAILPGSRRTFS
jgi:hypothetical protein